MAEMLPTTDPDLVTALQSEYTLAFQTGSQKDIVSARYRLVWGLVHSSQRSHVTRGLEMCKLNLMNGRPEDSKELRYFMAVALHKNGNNIASRRELTSLLQEHSDFRQAEVLKSLVDNAIVQDGIVGVGLASAAVAVVGMGLALLLGGGRGRR